MKKIISMVMVLSMILGLAFQVSADTDAWGREYKVYGDLKYQVQTDGTISIIGFDISKDTVEIPSQIDGKDVTRIGNYAFSSAYFIEEVVIPDTVTLIGTEAFMNCYELRNVVIPEGVTFIGNNAFKNCSKLKSVSLPSTLETLGEYAFTYSGLTSIVIPDNVKTIKYRAFYCCGSLTTAKFPTTVTTLGNDIFGFCKKLQTVELPTNIKTLPERLFYRCEGLKNVTIPNSVTKIDKYAFYYCTSLEDIVIPSGVSTIKVSAFEGCSGLKTVELSEGLTTMEKYIFRDCSSLETVTLPKSLTTAGNYCFAGCDNLDIKVYEDSYGYTYLNTTANKRDYIIECIEGSELLKYQFAAGNSDDKYCVRYLLVLDEEVARNAETASIYLSIDDDTTTQVVNIEKAYKGVYAAGKFILAGEGKVFVTCAFKNVPKEFDIMTAHVKLDAQRYERTSYYSDDLV